MSAQFVAKIFSILFGLVPGSGNSIALAMELPQSCII